MIRRLLTDERGTALTEFLITLPIFIIMFGGIIQLGLANERSIRVWVRAYRNTFTQAYLVQRAPLSLHSQATTGAAISLANINALPNNARRMGIGQRVIVLASDGVTYGNLAIRGTMGESYWRNRGTDLIFTQYGGSEDVLIMEGIQTQNIDDIVGDSDYAKALLNDAPSAPSFTGFGAGPLAAVNAVGDCLRDPTGDRLWPPIRRRHWNLVRQLYDHGDELHLRRHVFDIGRPRVADHDLRLT